MGENIYMLPSDMNLKIKTVLSGTTTKFSYPMGNLVWEKTLRLEAPAMKSTQTADSNEVLPLRLAHTPTITHNKEPKTVTHNDGKIALVLLLAGGFAIFNMFR